MIRRSARNWRYVGPRAPGTARREHLWEAALLGTAGDELAVGVRTDPQVARHEAYETAFLGVPDAGWYCLDTG